MLSQNGQRVHLVDTNGHDVPCTERRFDPEPDASDPACWPSWCDNWHWELTPDNLALMEAIYDIVDAPQAHEMRRKALDVPPISGGGFEPSEEDLAELAEWSNGGMSFPREASRAERLAIYSEFLTDYLAS
jgi:hypothetical protein